MSQALTWPDSRAVPVPFLTPRSAFSFRPLHVTDVVYSGAMISPFDVTSLWIATGVVHERPRIDVVRWTAQLKFVVRFRTMSSTRTASIIGPRFSSWSAWMSVKVNAVEPSVSTLRSTRSGMTTTLAVGSDGMGTPGVE